MTTLTYVREFFRLNTDKERPPRAYRPQLSRRRVGFGPQSRIEYDGFDHASFYKLGNTTP